MASEMPDEKAIFSVARSIAAPEARDEYLRQVCGSKRELRERVEILLGAYEEQASFLEVPPAGNISRTVEQLSLERPGTQIGPYRLLQEIGQGGMGVVYLAEQHEPVRRKVALKIVKPGLDSRQVVARFEAERQALSLMDHPNIAKVLDAGTTLAARPYFVMELVKGQPITEYCDRQHLTPRQRLELFLTVCRAIEHAHQKGIIHRDVKPSNVLVAEYDGRPVAKVIDFGVAKAIGQPLSDKTMFTGLGQIVGTFEYMSPEQARVNQLDVDTRSDIYSLGVLLYELLTGSTPLDKQRLRSAAWDEMLRIIREEEPPKPSTRLSESKDSLPSVSAQRQLEPAKLTKLVRGELDWIVMKALEKDRNRRYETANGLALDLERYLADEPVQACPPSISYRFRKFAQRHRTGLAVAALLCVVLVGGTTISIWQAILARQAERRAEEALRQESREHARAETNFRRTLAAVDSLLLEVGELDLAAEPQLEHVRRHLLEKSVQFFDEFLREQGDDVGTRFEAGLAYRRVGDVRAMLGLHRQADEDYGRGIEVLEPLTSEFPAQPEYRKELALTWHRRAVLMKLLGNDRDAAHSNHRARELQEKLVAAAPENADYGSGLASSQLLWATLLVRERQYEPALAAGRRAVALLASSEGTAENDASSMAALVRSRMVVAQVFTDIGDLHEAEQAYRWAIARANDLARRFGDGPDGPNARGLLARVHTDFGRFLWGRGHVAEAEASYRRAIEAVTPLVAQYPNVPGYQQSLAAAYAHLGGQYLEMGKHGEAVESLETSRQITAKLAAGYPLVPDYQSALGAVLSNLATARLALDEPETARSLLEQAIAHQAQALKVVEHLGYREQLVGHQISLARVLDELQVADEELYQAYEQAVDAARDLVQAYPEVAKFQSQLGAVLNNWGVLLKHRGQFDRVRSLAAEAITCQQAALRVHDSHPTYLGYLARHYELLADVLRTQGSRELEAVLRDLIPVRQRLADLFPAVPEHLSCLGKIENDLGGIARKRGASEDARQLFQAAIGHQKAALVLDPADPQYRHSLANHYGNLALALVGLGHREEARKAFAESVDIRKRLVADFPAERQWQVALGREQLVIAHLWGSTDALKDAAQVLQRVGGWPDAATAFQTAIPVNERSEAFELLLVAMFAWHLEFRDEAARWYRQAVAWETQHAASLPAARLEALRRVRRATEALLGGEATLP